MTLYRVNVPFEVQAPSGLTEIEIRNTICDLITNATIDLPNGWIECNALTADAPSSPDAQKEGE